MRSLKYSLALASLGGLLAFASCTLITDVDRSKIPGPDASTGEEAGDSNGGGNMTRGPWEGAPSAVMSGRQDDSF